MLDKIFIIVEFQMSCLSILLNCLKILKNREKKILQKIFPNVMKIYYEN